MRGQPAFIQALQVTTTSVAIWLTYDQLGNVIRGDETLNGRRPEWADREVRDCRMHQLPTVLIYPTELHRWRDATAPRPVTP